MPVKKRVLHFSEKQKLRIAGDIEISQTQHQALLKHINDRLEFSKRVRDPLADRFEIIDRELAGYIQLDEQDKKREQDNIEGKGPAITDQVIPLVITQLVECVTYVISVVAPDSGMYTAISRADQQDLAKGFARHMNKNAQTFGHFRNLCKGVLDMLKYNFGGFTVEWKQVYGNALEVDETSGTVTPEQKLVHEGNELTAIDPYNFFYDPSVKLVELPMKGEYFATTELKTPFTLERMEKQGEIFGYKELGITVDTLPEVRYYRQLPDVFIDHSGRGAGIPDFMKILSLGATQGKLGGVEVTDFYGHIIPKDFGLSESEEYEIWRFTLISDKRIVAATHLTNAHAMLPCTMGRPWEDGFENGSKAISELLMPYQRFASFQLNIHTRAARKKLYGVTIYNSRVINFEGSDPVAATIPSRPVDPNFDMRKAIQQFNDAPNTDNTLRDVSAMDDLMQRILPTDILRQVTSLERATQYQAASVVQGANRRNWLIAKLIDDQALKHNRTMQLYNVFQFQATIIIIDENGKVVTVNPAEFRRAEIEFDIADGLKGIDKLQIVESMRDIVNMVLQSKQANQEIDIVRVIDYFTSLLGDKTDFTQFRHPTPFDALSPEEKQLAFQLLQQFLQQQQGQGQPGFGGGGGGNVLPLPGAQNV